MGGAPRKAWVAKPRRCFAPRQSVCSANSRWSSARSSKPLRIWRGLLAKKMRRSRSGLRPWRLASVSVRLRRPAARAQLRAVRDLLQAVPDLGVLPEPQAHLRRQALPDPRPLPRPRHPAVPERMAPPAAISAERRDLRAFLVF